MAADAKTMQDRRRELLRQRIAQSGAQSGSPATESAQHPVLQAGARYPLSAGQRRMWFLQTLDPTDTTLNICVGYRLTGPLDEARLRDSASAVAARHAVLRTRYRADADGEPYQQFRDDVEIAWQTHDLSGLGEAERAARLDALSRAEFGRPFDLAGEAPLRMTLVRAGAEEFVLLLVIHHICWDDGSWAVFFAELAAAYNGRPPAGPAVQYVAVEVLADTAEPAEGDVEYWRTALRGLPEPVELPGPAPVQASRRAERRTRALPAELHQRVEDFARAHAATPFMVLLAAFGALLRRYTGAPDFLVAIPVVERPAAASGAIGYFGNTLLLRIATTSQDTFVSLTDAVRDTCLDGYAHQGVGLDRVVREVNPDRAAGHDGLEHLVRLGFSMRSSVAGLALDRVVAHPLEVGAPTAQLPLALAVVREPDSAFVEFEYHADVLGEALVDQMLSHYLRLLDAALSQPGHRVADLELLGADERATVLARSRGELVATPATTMVALLESAATATPAAVAVVSDDAELTYHQLHGRANRLARWLIGKGVGTEGVVGLRMNASVEFVVAALAVWKAGAAYLPIDPAYPNDRIEYLIADTNPYLVIGREGFDAAEAAAAALADTPVTDAERIRPLRPGNLAYLIYTSGSTGRPKGVAVEHQAIAEHLDGFIAEWSMTAQDRLLQSSSVSFDASLPEMFMTLAIGARLVLPKPDAVADIGYLTELIQRHGVTVLHLVPSMLSALLLLAQTDQWRGLRLVPVGGEALPGQLAVQFADEFDAQLRNHYGPTEAVVCATHKLVDQATAGAVVPIGVPNRNVYAYVLDQQLQLAPTDVVGELYLGGNQLARGYFGRAGLTAQRFVADPFNPGMRLYRTGDLVRRNSSGELEFVGRADEQVKVRGFRIELGEVESVIASHPAVRHALVLVEDSELGPALTAYLVPAAELDLDAVRAHAAAMLPGYMVPSGFAVIPEIPLTVSGKLDKDALPTATRVAARGHREPATATEHRMCSIFGRLFGVERVSAEDSFFELGGHSLLAARLVAQIRADFGVDLTVRTVFDTPTPAGLAARLVEQFRADFDIDLDEAFTDAGADADTGAFADTGADVPAAVRPELVAADRPPRPPLSYAQAAMWFQHRMRGASDVLNVALALHLDGPLDRAALGAALNDVVARHEALRTNIVDHQGVPYQLVHPDRRLELDIEAIPADQLDAALTRLRRHVFTLESEPLIKPTLVELGGDRRVLLVLIHHIVVDHTSLGVLCADLMVAYRARLSGTAPRWAAAAPQFADYAVWQRDVFAGGNPWGQAELAYWRDSLGGMPYEIPLAADHARPAVLSRRAEVRRFAVSAERRTALRRCAESSDASEFMVYQAVLAVVLQQLGGGTDIAVGSPVAARTDPAAADLIGPCANVVVLRNDLSGDPTLRTVLTRSRDVVLDALAHQDLPIDRVVEALNPPRSPSRDHPLFQAVIQFRGEDWALAPRDFTGSGTTTVAAVPLEFDFAVVDVAVTLTVAPDGGLQAQLLLNADVYDGATAELVVDAVDGALDAFATAPDRPLSGLRLLPPEVLAKQPAAAPRPRPASATTGSERTERALIAILQELLDITDVDREDNFFALGGDSIVSVQWAARATAAGLALTPAMVFEHLTIAELAAAVDTAVAAVDTADTAAAQSPAAAPPSQPMSASGLDEQALAALTAAWQQS